MKIYKYIDYALYLKDYIANRPRNGRGEISKMAAEIGVHTTLMSLILSGQRDLSAEQCFDLSRYLNLTDSEQEFFSTMVQYRRAGSSRLKSHLRAKLQSQRDAAIKAERHFEHEKKLTEHHQTQFYSSWIYSAIRLFCTTEERGKSLDQIVEKFSLTRQKAIKHLEFLLQAGLIVTEEDRYKMGVSRTFLERGSVSLSKHHTNWRLRAIQKIDDLSDQEMMFTSPISVSREDFENIRSEISTLIKNVSARVKDSPAEEVACLNIDLFYVLPNQTT